MDARGKKKQHWAITLALSIILGAIVIVVAAASVLTSGIFERQMRMLTTIRTSEIFETNINNEINSLKDALKNIEMRIESLSKIPRETDVSVEIKKLKELVGELNSREKKIEEIMIQNPSNGSTISKVSRTRSSRSRHRK